VKADVGQLTVMPQNKLKSPESTYKKPLLTCQEPLATVTVVDNISKCNITLAKV